MVSIDRWQTLSDKLTLFDPYPNPVSEEVLLSWEQHEAGEMKIRLLDMGGKEVLQVELGKFGPGKQEKTVEFPRLAAGTYSLIVELGDVMAGRKIQVK